MAAEITYDALFDAILETIKLTADKRHAADLVVLVKRSGFAIRGEYLAINSLVKAKYMKTTNCRLDRHKCSASFMIAFMKKLIMEPDNSQYEGYREKLAILAGLTVMGTFIKGDAHNYNNAGIIAFLIKNSGFVLPGPLCDEIESYDKSWALELRSAYNAHKNKETGFSALSLANELFLIESYNRKLAEIEQG
jgi:hypothetical protein